MSDQTPTGRTIVVSKQFQDSLSPEQLRDYLDAIVATSQSAQGADAGEIADELRARMDQAGIGIAHVEADHLAEHLVGGDTPKITIITDAGEVLLEQDGAVDQPGQQASRDPENDDRPALT